MQNKFRYIVKNHPFLKTLGNYLTGETSIKALGIISIPILTRLLSPAEYGILSIYTSLLTFLIIILPLNLHASLRPRLLKHPKNFHIYLGTVHISALLLGFLIAIVFLLFANKISNTINIPSKLFTFAIISSYLLITKEIYLRVLLGQNDSKNYARISFLFNFLDILLTIVFIFFLKENRYYGKAYANIIVAAFFLVLSIIKLNSVISWKFNLPLFKHALIYSIPLIIHASSHFILAQFDRIVINQLIDSSSTGFYSLAYSVSALLMVIITAVNNSWVPIFYKSLDNKDIKPLENKLKNFSTIVLIGAFGLILFGKEIIFILAPKEYSSASNLIPILVLGNVFIYLYMIYANYSFYSGKTYIIAINTLTSGILNVILNYIFIPKYGIQAAAYTTLVSYIVLFLLHYLSTVLFNKTSPIINIFPVFKIFLGGFFIYLLLSWIASFLNENLEVLIKLIAIILILFYYKSRFISIK